MSNDLAELLPALAESIAISLQEGAFIMCWQVDDTGELPAPVLYAEVAVRCAHRTLFVGISVTNALARQVAQDTLGELDAAAIAQEDVRDAVLELANVVAGRLSRSVSHDGALVSLSAPSLRVAPHPDGMHVAMATDGGELIRCTLREAGP
ncbi:MAG: hypothetical protein RLZZ299_1065 [Pseudomonadota bacterium]|jgi:hypothetical protein